MKKFITIILALAIAISGMAVPGNKAGAEALPFQEDSYVEAEDTDDTEEQEIEDIRVENWITNDDNDIYMCKFAKRFNAGSTLSITKGFTETIRLDSYEGAVKWTTDNPKVITVKTKPISKKVQKCTVKGKKYGKATLTAEYNGQKTIMKIKVVKNQFSRKIKDLPLSAMTSLDGATGKERNLGKYRLGVTSAKFNKKGELVIKCYEEYYKPSKWGKKAEYRSVPTYNNLKTIEITNGKGKVVVKYQKKVGKGKDWEQRSLSVQHPIRRETIVVPKKKLKNKKIDLRRVNYDYWHYCGPRFSK